MHNARHKFSKAKTLLSLMVFLSVLCGPALNMSLPKKKCIAPLPQGQEKLKMRLCLLLW